MSSQPGSRPRSAIVETVEETPVIKPGEKYTFGYDVDNIKMHMKWTTRQMGMICDLELMVFMFDERVSALLYQYIMFDWVLTTTFTILRQDFSRKWITRTKYLAMRACFYDESSMKVAVGTSRRCD